MISRILKKQSAQPSCDSAEVTLPSLKPLFFVHIPKTAGTSFRKALEDKQPMKKDYGAKACETSPLVRSNMHDEVNPYALKQAMLEQPFALTGHVHVQKYADFFNIRNIITFVREPIGQIVSHYNHFVNHNGFEGDFAKFYRAAQFRDVQARYLNGFPVTLLGFTGLTEHYNDSLSIINHGLGLELAPRKQNVGAKPHQNKEALPQEVIDELVKLNPNDVRLYRQALELHQQRMALFEQGKPWAHLYATINPNDVLHGCAYFASGEEPVTLVVKVNGVEKAMLTAQDFFGLFPKFNLPRQRYVGFSLPLSQLDEESISELEIMVRNTGQTYRVELPERFKQHKVKQ
ncbi:sulfotransferase family 2 domain-containing protein [Vibrio sp. B1FLJ16]|uniref:sulfotransferase family 2 domain-containing protein n=1 Tax=Vibrio sp. B1FLJ16 TaxID=2751178 RepID=UPI0015F5C4D9|nr:sulfotransferase family 2 domain-containing protein [Vibrio sp. B1FLJ16]CAD7807313.1 O-methyltransferase activity [Vibrio sp. B1FLJ16]CAE6905343.1 O-methyltransferase activity [Vibrio sp. B1FLJ16]